MNEKQKVLLIDDDEALVFAAEQVLKKEGFEVFVASNGTEGLEKARNEKPDVIILDILMPGIDGYEVCRRLKNDPKTDCIKVIILSSKGETDFKKGAPIIGLKEVYQGYDCGACNFLTKPVTARELLKAVRDELKWSALLTEQ
jgi:DNA-binding response OmpR family regulator